MIKARHSSKLASRRRSTALSSLRGTREGQPAGKEALAGLLDFLASPSGTSSSGSLTPTTIAEAQPTAQPQTLPAVHNTAQISLVGSATNSAEPKKEKKKKKEKKAKTNESDKKSEAPKKEKGSRSPGSAAKKGSKSPSEAKRTQPDRLAMAALLEREKLEWEKEVRTPTHKATGSADMATVKMMKKERRLSFTLRRRSSANLSAMVEQAGCTPQDAFFVEGGGSQAEHRVYNTARAKTLRMSKREARMTWSPEIAAEMITQNNGSPVRFA